MNNESTGLKYNINDFVMYRKNGICQIIDIRSENFFGAGEETYYIMSPVNDKNSKIYVPANSEFIRDILTKEQIDKVIEKAELNKEIWMDDSRLRSMRFEQLLHTGESSEILWLVKVLSLHKAEVEEQKKKFYASDERILETANRIIKEEFAFSLGISENDVIPYIIDKIKK